MEAVRVKVKEEVMIVVDDLGGIGDGMIFEEDEEKREKVDEIYSGSGGGMTFEEKFDGIDGGSGGSGGGSGGDVTFEDEVEKKEEKLDEIDGGGSGGEVTFEDGAEKEGEKFDEIDGGGSGCGDGVVKLEQQAPIVKYNGGGGGGGIEIKEEEKLELDEVDVNGGGGGGGSSDSSSSIRLPKPMSGLHDFSPPPFLTKTYEMVEDPATDLIVSWSVGGGESFIVWDDIEFSTSLLPRYFKHSNFSSFIRQLNTYGFRKVHHDRWEFANEAFLRGKRNLLKNIKRRQVGLSSSNLQQEAKNVAEMAKIELETQVESLKKDQNLLQVEILNLRQQQETSANHIAAFERRIQCSAFSHQKLVCFFRKTVGCPNFMEKMKRRQRRELGCCGCGRCGGGGIEKRRRLVNGTNQVGLLPKDTTAQYASMDNIHHHHHHQQQQQQPSGSSPVLDHITNVNSEGNDPNSSSPKYENLFLEKIKEDLFDESEADEVPSGGSNSSYLHDLQDLIMTSDWNNYAQLVEEQMNFT